MDVVLRAVIVYLALLVLFRVMGKRTLSQVTTFDFVLILVVGEATGQVLVGDDFSVAAAATVIVTLVSLDRIADYLGFRFPKLDQLLESSSILLVDDGEILQERLRKSHVSVEEILTEGRRLHGLESLDQIKFAVLEKDGAITIVPQSSRSTP